MNQLLLFDDPEFKPKNRSGIYSGSVKTPVYHPRGPQPHIGELVDDTKTRRLIREIEESDLPEHEKEFLIKAAQRHLVFNYERIADYYASASPEMQRLMERSALVVIDFGSAYENGYIKLTYDIAYQYFEHYGAGPEIEQKYSENNKSHDTENNTDE